MGRDSQSQEVTGHALILGKVPAWTVWLEGTSSSIMRLGGLESVQNALWLGGVTILALSSDGSFGYSLQLSRVTSWVPCLSKATGCVQKSSSGVNWTLQVSSTIMGWARACPRLLFRLPSYEG